MENLDVVQPQDAIDTVGTPSDETGVETQTVDTTQDEEDLSPEQITQEAEKLKNEAKETKDQKEKRHLEQQAWRLQQLAKAKERASLAEQKATEREQRLERIEIESVYEKAIQSKYGVDYFEEVYKTDPDLANKVAKEKWGKSAKEMIREVKKQEAEKWNDSRKQELSNEDLEAEIEHKYAIKYAYKVFDDLDDEEKKTAKKYFDKIAGTGKMDGDTALELADMAKHYAMRNRKSTIAPKEKEKILASASSTTIWSKGDSESTEDLEKQYIALGIEKSLAKKLANVKL